MEFPNMKRTSRRNYQESIGNLCVTHQCDARETSHWRELWRDAFAKQGHGVGLHQFLWHVFSAERYPAISGEEADAQYLAHEATEYVILPNDKSAAFFSSSRPQQEWYLDFYVFPKNMAWTMAYTHEIGWYGPYFARHPNYLQLQAENIQALNKQRDIAIAKQKGWI
jgi:hypothetical protein